LAAIEVFSREKPDIILLDVIMPGIDGIETATRIRALEAKGEWTPIIFLSAMTSDEDLERGITAGGDDYIYKPVSEVVLGAKIRAMQRIIQMRTALIATTRQLDSANQELKRLSASDGLTGIANRRCFDETLTREWRRARRTKSSVALIMCDVDHFKLYNDTYGHQGGDDCLRNVARAICSVMDRPADIAARYGGEEFAVILPDTPVGGALVVAEKIRHAIHAMNMPHSASSFSKVTLSLGIAAFAPEGDEPQQFLIERADRALYRAKHAGRDRVCRFDPAVDSGK
jgi:diguanylate cyclase (GGDEF)-like protein